MNTSYRCYLTESATRGVRKIIGGLVLFGGLVFLAGCPNPGGGTKDQTKPTTTTDPTQPDGPKISVTLNENGPETLVTLPYRGQEDAVPVFCEVSSPSMVIVTKDCACSAGACRVGVKPVPNVFGDGAFEFRLSGPKGILSNTGKASVKILEVKLSISSGNNRRGDVGKPLDVPIVVLVQNSYEVPVPGVKIFWSVNRPKGTEEWPEEQVGKVDPCDEKTDNEGLAKCTWTLGTKAPVGTEQGVNVSAFSRENAKKTQRTTFAVTARPGPLAFLSFWSQDYMIADGADNVVSPSSFNGPTTPKWATDRSGGPLGGKFEVAGKILGGDWFGVGRPALVVFAQDQYGNAITIGDKVVEVTLALVGAPGVLKGTTKVALTDDRIAMDTFVWSQAVAAFGDLYLENAGTYTFTATTAEPNVMARGEDIDSPFTVEPDIASELRFSTQPGEKDGVNAKAGFAFPTQPAVAILDRFGNTVTPTSRWAPPLADLNVGLAVATSNPGGVLGGTATVKAVNGVAIFSGLSVNGKLGKYKLTASSEVPAVGTTPAVPLAALPSEEFAVDPGDPFKLKFRAQPNPGRLSPPSGSVRLLSPQPVVEVLDRFGNITTNFSHTQDKSATVTLAIPSDISSLGGTLGGGNTSANIVSGVATFNGLLISGATAGLYKLTATGSAVLTADQPAVTLEKDTTTDFRLEP